MNNINKRNIIWNMIGATASAFNSLFFTIITTRINGVDEAGIFTYSFATACLLYVIAVYLGRTFQVTDLSGKYSDTDYIYNRIFTCIVMIVTAVGFCLIKRYNTSKSAVLIVLCVLKAVEAFSESIYAVIQKNEQLYKVGISMFSKSIIGLLAFLIIDIITKNMIISCATVVIVNILVLLCYDIRIMTKSKFIKTKYSNKVNWSLLQVGFNAFALNFLAIYLINSPRYAIDDMLPSRLQTVFGIIIMPATFMGLLGQYIVQPMLTRISKNIKNQEYDELEKTVIKILLMIAVLGTLVFIVAYVLEVPVFKLIYGLDLQEYKTSMLVIIIGSILYSYSIVLSTILISMRKNFIQVVIYGICAIFSTILAYITIKNIEILGASVTYLLTMAIVTISFIICVFRKINQYKKVEKKG